MAVVGVGASAGGLEAFTQLLQALPARTGMGFVLVQHLDPQHDSRLADMLAKATPMPVVEAAHGMSVEPDHVYVIAPNTTLTLAADGTLHVEPRGERGSGPHLPIDQLFRSLAAHKAGAAIGVVLSGTGSDGALGLEEIKAAGGITLAQDENSAKFAGMPLAALHSGCVDLVLPPERIAAELVRVGRHPFLAVKGEEQADNTALALTSDAERYKSVLKMLRAAHGVDFSAYRDSTIKRRIVRRMLLRGGDSLAAYVERLHGDRAELDALYQDILINVTRFFRDAEVFEALKQRAFPDILAARQNDTPIRFWVPGCSTGQEAYSLAMALLEFLDDKPARPPVQIFATDLSENVSLVKARGGLYPASIEAEVSPERLRRFFQREDGHYRINKALREMVVFARQNVAADPPFSRVDLISCRNLLIYLSPALQKRVLPTFHYALNPGGFLLLGASETIGPHGDLFAVVDQAHRIYSRKSSAGLRPYPHFRADDQQARMAGGSEAAAPARPLAADWQREADRVAAGQYVPPGVLINDDFDILQFRGQTGPFLAPAAGEPSHNLMKMARDGLFVAVRAAVIECQRSDSALRQPGVRIRGEGVDREVDLHVMPVKLPQAGERCYLVLFEETARRATPLGDAAPPAAAGEVYQLRQELASTREYLQSLIEQQDAANEELKSANEETLSSNEELQSTNEELETAKEELQSINEELTTVNEQLQHRNAELARLNDDMSNLLTSSGVATIVLGTDQRIRRFTPAAGKLLGLLAADIGRPVGHLKASVELPELEALVSDVIASVQPQERELRGPDGRCYQLRINPYRTADHHIDGAVLVLFDIEEARSAQEAASRHLTQLVEQDRLKTAFLAMLAHELRNPLAPIRNALHVLDRVDGDDQATAQRMRATLQRQVAQLTRLVDDLLDVARINQGRVAISKRRVDLVEVLRDSVDTAQAACRAKDIKLSAVLPETALAIDVDATRVAQAVGNLLNNACKFTDAGGSIEVTLASDGGEALISVRDSGIGIAADQLPRVFDMFMQIDSSLERSRGGLGLGLTLVKQLIDAHGGSVSASSGGAGRGSEFVLRLPLPQQPAPLAQDAEPATESPPAGAQRRILVVDDSLDGAETLALALGIEGHDVRIANDGPAALALAAQWRPEVVLLDIGLPGMNGYEVARQLGRQPWRNEMRLFALTGWGQPEDRRRSAEAGFDVHLVKPVEVETLTRLLAESPD